MEKFHSLPIRKETIEEDKMTIEEFIERLNNNVSVLEKCNHKWVSLLKGNQRSLRIKNTKRLQKVQMDIEVLMTACKVIACFKSKLKCVKQKFEQKEICEQRAILHPTVLNLPLSNRPLDTHSLSSQSVANGSLTSSKVNIQKYSCQILMEIFSSNPVLSEHLLINKILFKRCCSSIYFRHTNKR